MAGSGPEAAAREARYSVLEEVAERFGSSQVLLGHTLDDQAETVLLGLARGSGGRSIAGMRPAFDRFRRPLLEVTRAQTEAACTADGITWWDDPHNSDPSFTRSRVRGTVMPVLERELGPGVAAALARTATQLQRDVAELDAQARAAYDDLLTGDGLPVDRLALLPDAIRHRVLRLAALDGGALAADLTHGHVLAVDELVTGLAWAAGRRPARPPAGGAPRGPGRLPPLGWIGLTRSGHLPPIPSGRRTCRRRCVQRSWPPGPRLPRRHPPDGAPPP